MSKSFVEEFREYLIAEMPLNGSDYGWIFQFNNGYGVTVDQLFDSDGVFCYWAASVDSYCNPDNDEPYPLCEGGYFESMNEMKEFIDKIKNRLD